MLFIDEMNGDDLYHIFKIMIVNAKTVFMILKEAVGLLIKGLACFKECLLLVTHIMKARV